MLEQMFVVTIVTATRFDAAMQTFAPLIDSTASSIVVAETRESVDGYQATRVKCPST